MAYRVENGQSELQRTITDNYTLQPSDNGALIILNAATQKNVTVPDGVLPLGFHCRLLSIGAGSLKVIESGTAQVKVPSGPKVIGYMEEAVLRHHAIIDQFNLAFVNVAHNPDMLSTMLHKWKAADLGLADNDPVPTWADSVGSADGTSAGSPTYKDNAGDPYVEFDGTNDIFTFPTGSYSGDLTYVMVVNVMTGIAAYDQIFRHGTTGPALYYYTPTFTGTSHGIYFVNNFNGPSIGGSLAAPTSGFSVFLVKTVGGYAKLHVNTDESGLVSTAGVITTGTDFIVGSTDGATFTPLQVKEIMIFEDDVNDNQFAAIASYINTEYGLSL